MRKASYINPGISIFLFMLFLLIRLGGLMLGETLGGFLHLLLLALVLPIIGFLVGSVLLLISLTKKQNQRSVNKKGHCLRKFSKGFIRLALKAG